MSNNKTSNNSNNSKISIYIISAIIAIAIWIPVYTMDIPTFYLSIVSWIWTMALLLCVRNTKGFFSYLIFFIVLVLSLIAGSYGTFGQNIDELLPNLITGLCIFPTFLIDSLICKKHHSFALTLVFPVLYTLSSVLTAYFRIMPNLRMDTFQSQILPSFQIVSLIGSYGFTFIVTWIFSCVAYLLLNKKGNIKAIAIVCPLILIAAIFVFGFIRLNSVKEPEYYITAAYANGPYRSDAFDEEYEVPYEEYEKYLSSTCEEASNNGAAFIAFTEEAFFLYEDTEDKLIKYAQSVAKKNKINILLGVEKWYYYTEELGENAIIWINSEGDIEIKALKSNLIPLLESRYFMAGDKNPSYVEIEVDGHKTGISMAVCYDGEFSLYTNRMNKDTDIFVLPSWDWKNIREKHKLTTSYIPVQSHVTMFKPTYDGYTYVMDPYGRYIYNDENENYMDNLVHIVTLPVYDL